jgi:hypothetical protein|tara:strand:- start:166838 stop:167773 length:936 start_codon:yes stop_codon:yes gene_type:complete
MDYLQIYNTQFDATWAEIKSKTIDDLKAAKKKKKNFTNLFEKININLNDEKNKILDDFTKHNLKECFKLFEKRHSLYDSDLERKEVISLILENEVKEAYLKSGKSEYKEFVKTIAKQQSIEKINNHFYNYWSYYELIYKKGRYKYFYAKDFENISYENSKEYVEMIDYKASKRTGDPSFFEIEKTQNENDSVKSSITTRERISNEFDVNERAVLFYLLKNRLKIKMLDSTELMRLILVIGATDRFEIFEGTKASDNYLYKQANKGYAVFKKTEQKDKIAHLKVKLINNGLKFIAEELQIDYSQFFNNKRLK